MASEKHQIHFVLMPLMAPGHFIPMVDMAKLLAQQGVMITVVTTPLVASRFCATVDRAIASGLHLRLHQIRFPSAEAGLPDGCESVDMVPSLHLMKNFLLAIALLQQPFEHLFEHLEPTPNCIIADKHLPWVAETARKFRVPRISFDGMSCFTVLCLHNLHISRVHESTPESEPFVIPGLPDKIQLTRAQLPSEFNPGSLNTQDFRKRVRAGEEAAYGVVINSFEELEPEYVKEFKKVRGERVWCVGPLSLCNKDDLDKAQRGNKAAIDETRCLDWLNSQAAGSVVYACLGSISRHPPPQLAELGLALEASNRPFVWVVRGGGKSGGGGEGIEKWVEEYGFEERTNGRGLLIRGWAPQVLILSHPAVGAFLTHCGWNSTLEGLVAGVPMVTWPIFAEQFLNEKLVVEVLRTAVSVGAPVVVHLLEQDKAGVLVRREAVAKAVAEVMEEGGEGRERRERARKLGDMARKAMEERGSSRLNVTSLIQNVTREVVDKAA